MEKNCLLILGRTVERLTLVQEVPGLKPGHGGFFTRSIWTSPWIYATMLIFVLQHLMNAAAFKARTISRSKNRDKRSAVIAC
jgi:hypothetical protein